MIFNSSGKIKKNKENQIEETNKNIIQHNENMLLNQSYYLTAVVFNSVFSLENQLFNYHLNALYTN